MRTGIRPGSGRDRQCGFKNGCMLWLWIRPLDNSKGRWVFPPSFQLVEKVFFEYFLCAAHPSLSVAKLWLASAIRKVITWERALPSPLPRFFEKNRVKLLILRTFLRNSHASADSRVSAKPVFRQAKRMVVLSHRPFNPKTFLTPASAFPPTQTARRH